MIWEKNTPGLQDEFTLRMKTTFKPDTSGNHTLSIITTGDSDLVVNGKQIISYRPENGISSDIFHNSPAFEQRITIPMQANSEYEITLTAFSSNVIEGEQFPIQFFRIGFYPEYSVEDLLASAVEVASAADVAIVFAGANEDWETEGWDRPDMDVPFRQNELIQAVAKVKPTIVVLHSGSPLDVSPWFDSVQAIVQSWFLGQGTPYWM